MWQTKELKNKEKVTRDGLSPNSLKLYIKFGKKYDAISTYDSV
jgi:hypothetical protein